MPVSRCRLRLLHSLSSFIQIMEFHQRTLLMEIQKYVSPLRFVLSILIQRVSLYIFCGVELFVLSTSKMIEKENNDRDREQR